MSIPVGITVPKLLPITGTFTPLFAAYYTVLSARVVASRTNEKKFIGTSESETDPLSINARSHANFAENVPFALLLGAIVEMNGGNRKALAGGFAALFLFRVAHVEFGLRGEKSLQWGRATGFLGTLGFITGTSVWAAYLVKGYWGL